MIFFLSYCWNKYPNTTFYTNEYRYLSSIIWLEIDEEVFKHDCSNTYIDSNSPTGYCVCQIYSEHPNHTHQCYDNEIEYTSSQHWKRCLCGERIEIAEHSFTYAPSDSEDNHRYVCSICKYEKVSSHIYSYSSISGSLHRVTCACGISEIEIHTFEPTANPRYYSCKKCGYLKDNLGSGSENIIKSIKKDDELE